MLRAFDLDSETESKWEELFASSGRFSDEKNHQEAIELADQAWDLIPDPKNQCSVAYITNLRRITVRYSAGEWIQGANIAQEAADTTPFERQIPVFLVKAGIGLFEAGEREAARESFDMAWKNAKDFGFKSEDRKYLEFYRSGV